MKNKDMVRYDANGCFELRDAALRELADVEIAAVAGGAGNRLCFSPEINTVCSDGDGRIEFLTHGNHTLNGVC